MGFDISEFSSSISSTGVANASNFKVIITPPSTLQIDELSMRCESVDFPGRNVEFVETGYTGSNFKVAMGSSTPEINISIILSADFREKVDLLKWQDKIIGPYRNGQVAGNMFNISYYDDYKGKVTILQYKDDTEEVAYSCDLIDAYPASIGNVTGNWQDGGVIHKLPVTFIYRYFTDRVGE